MIYPLPRPGEVALPGYPRVAAWLGDPPGTFRIDGEVRRVAAFDLDKGVSEWARIEGSPWQVRHTSPEVWSPFEVRLAPSGGGC